MVLDKSLQTIVLDKRDDNFDENNPATAFQQAHSNSCYLQVAVMVSGYWTENIHSMQKRYTSLILEAK